MNPLIIYEILTQDVFFFPSKLVVPLVICFSSVNLVINLVNGYDEKTDGPFDDTVGPFEVTLAKVAQTT